MNKELAGLFRKKANKALEKVREELKMDSISLGNIRFDSDSLSVNLQARVLPIDPTTGKIMDKDKADWNKHCATFGFKISDWDSQITVDGKRYRLIGINPKKKKYPVVALGKEGRIGFTDHCVRNALKTKETLKRKAAGDPEDSKPAKQVHCTDKLMDFCKDFPAHMDKLLPEERAVLHKLMSVRDETLTSAANTL